MSETDPTPFVYPPEGWADAPQDLIKAVLSAPAAKIIIDVSEAKSISTQSAQLLLALQSLAEERGTQFTLHDVSESAQKSLQTLGLDQKLLEPQT